MLQEIPHFSCKMSVKAHYLITSQFFMKNHFMGTAIFFQIPIYFSLQRAPLRMNNAITVDLSLVSVLVISLS